MNSFRYRTKTLLGPWRETSEAAIQDAIRAKQARRDDDGAGWHWVIDGSIEEGHDRPPLYSRNDNFQYPPQLRSRA